MQRDVRTRKKEFLGSISGGQNVPTWRTKREQLKDTLITPRPSCLLWCTRETIGPQGPKNSSTWSLASEISSFSSFLFLCDEGARSYISLVALRVRGFDVSKRPTKLLRPWRTFQPHFSRIGVASLSRAARNPARKETNARNLRFQNRRNFGKEKATFSRNYNNLLSRRIRKAEIKMCT